MRKPSRRAIRRQLKRMRSVKKFHKELGFLFYELFEIAWGENQREKIGGSVWKF